MLGRCQAGRTCPSKRLYISRFVVCEVPVVACTGTCYGTARITPSSHQAISLVIQQLAGGMESTESFFIFLKTRVAQKHLERSQERPLR